MNVIRYAYPPYQVGQFSILEIMLYQIERITQHDHKYALD